MKIADWFRLKIIKWLRLEEMIQVRQFAKENPYQPVEEKVITGSNYKLEWIQTAEQYKKLEAFAATFEHKIVRSTSPLVVIKKNGQWIGYAQINKTPVVLSAWHTDKKVCSSRDMVEAYKMFSGWLKIQHGGGFATVPLDTSTFLPHVMKKLGLARCNCELYEVTAE